MGDLLGGSHRSLNNFRYIFFMIVAMVAFAVEDAIIKQLAFTLPISQVLISVVCGSLVLYGVSIF